VVGEVVGVVFVAQLQSIFNSVSLEGLTNVTEKSCCVPRVVADLPGILPCCVKEWIVMIPVSEWTLERHVVGPLKHGSTFTATPAPGVTVQ
jgi:hypothetical protein